MTIEIFIDYQMHDSSEWETVEFTPEEYYDRERALILLLLNDGNTQAQVAQTIGCSLRKVVCWSVHGDPDNIESFQDERMKGNYRKATPAYIEKLLEVVELID